ncbi:bifunctional helix-turn-helix transcriptional regulator/GNAT family N-acetyltransferase [Agromyces bauzanensis]|uniref:Transcriptional regulator, MarR family protein n=1 Tax=Agromyces bauzanensis TaxID=1308924 RepID=A0A917PR10_9MICO|nr:helix-turn-helix domain-containing GNAT family N-acetyltransferase [Agromyces bauzanensis]GGJ87805.1 putative transcriptional regulator, MarR family protein [Agromyces bauzanensis]
MSAPIDAEAVASVRAFNRAVTTRIGALRDHHLGGGRSLGASRVLWEVDGDGVDVRDIRERLELDSGYLSRLLRSLEREGLVTVAGSPADPRVRSVRPTDAGRGERAELDRRSDELAASLLAPLSDGQRLRLIDAMDTVMRLLDAGLVEVESADAASDDARRCLAAYYDELARRFPDGFDPGQSLHPDTHEFTEPTGLFVLARLHDRAIGCGAVLFQEDGRAYLKRMWVDESMRGTGVGRRILDALEQAAREHGAASAVLETNETLTQAIAMYRASGYVEVEPFNDEFYADLWFAKPLA